MQEISVIVSQEPGRVSWNNEEIKKNLEESLAVYQNTVYDDSSIKTAKSDVAYLRSLAQSIEDRRKEIKNKCLEPYEIIEKQAKELVALIDKPIEAIDVQVKDYERRRKEKVRAEIEAFWLQQSTYIPENLREKAHAKIYDSRWENASATKKSWKTGIEDGVAEIVGSIGIIKGFESEFESEMMEKFAENLSLKDAVVRMNELKAQKEKILEAERIRQEQEAAKKAAMEKAEQEKKEKPENASVNPAPMESKSEDTRSAKNVDDYHTLHEQKTSWSQKPDGCCDPKIPLTNNGATTRVLKIIGTAQQIAKIKDYIRFTGASFKEI